MQWCINQVILSPSWNLLCWLKMYSLLLLLLFRTEDAGLVLRSSQWGAGLFGFWEFGGGGGGSGEVSLQATWDRGGRILSQLGGFQVSGKGKKGRQREISKGSKEQGECAMYIVICVRVHKECLRRLNDTSCVYGHTVPTKSLGRSYSNSMKRAINSVKSVYSIVGWYVSGHSPLLNNDFLNPGGHADFPQPPWQRLPELDMVKGVGLF